MPSSMGPPINTVGGSRCRILLFGHRTQRPSFFTAPQHCCVRELDRSLADMVLVGRDDAAACREGHSGHSGH